MVTSLICMLIHHIIARTCSLYPTHADMTHIPSYSIYNDDTISIKLGVQISCVCLSNNCINNNMLSTGIYFY